MKLGCTAGLILAGAASAALASANVLMMPNRDALKGTQVVVWGNTKFANGSPFEIDFGDGSPTVNGNVADRSYISTTHTYNAQGNFIAKLTVSGESETVKISVFDPATQSAENLRDLGINMAIQDGLRWLYVNQGDRALNFTLNITFWASTSDPDYVLSQTSLAALALQNHGHLVVNDPNKDIFQAVVQRGLNYLFDKLTIVNLSAEMHGPPDVVGGAPVIRMDDPCIGVPLDGNQCQGLGRPIAAVHSVYADAVESLALAAATSSAPNRTVDVGLGADSGGFVAARTYKEILQRQLNAIVWSAQNSGIERGGYGYRPHDGLSDGSVLGWVMLALLDGAAVGATVPNFAKTELEFALGNQINPDGSLRYQATGGANVGNFAKTAILLQAMKFINAPIGDSRVQSALNYLSNRWNAEGTFDTFICSNGTHNIGCAYGMFNAFKGLKLYAVQTLAGVPRPAGPGAIPAGDWHADYQDWLVANQQNPTSPAGGSWGLGEMGFSTFDDSTVGTTALAELMLAPVALVLPDPQNFTTVALQPFTAEKIVGTQHTVTAKAVSAVGNPIPAATIKFEVISGPNTGKSGTDITDSNGEATFTYTDTNGPGTDNIQAFLGALGSNVVEVIWKPNNNPPVAKCKNVTVDAGVGGTANVGAAQFDNGSFDPDGDPITITVTPAGPYPIGTTTVTVTVTDSKGLSSTCQATVTVLGPRGIKERLLTDIIALRATLTDKEDSKKVDDSIKYLRRSLTPEFWIDQTHLNRVKGYHVFHEERDSVVKLRDLRKYKNSNIADALLLDLITRHAIADRILAAIAVNESTAAGGDALKLATAQEHMLFGDQRFAVGEYDNAIERYREGWQQAMEATK
ncbi:MAG: Ig-like domain-containing protein [Acidobacteria bacterium]|nr:Ig-like domain-containing protein [Acidobacteriota bacterium]